MIAADYSGIAPGLQVSGSVNHAGTVGAPIDKIAEKNDRELEAYLWEMDHLANTGLKDTREVYVLWDKSSDAWLNASAPAKKKMSGYGKSYNAVWKIVLDGHVAAVDAEHKTFTKKGALSDRDYDFALAVTDRPSGQTVAFALPAEYRG